MAKIVVFLRDSQNPYVDRYVYCVCVVYIVRVLVTHKCLSVSQVGGMGAAGSLQQVVQQDTCFQKPRFHALESPGGEDCLQDVIIIIM